MYAVYKITDLRSNEVIYVGKTKNFEQRQKAHFTDARPKIDKYMLEQGRANFEMSIIQDGIESNDEAVKLEDQYIVEFKPIMNKHRSGNIKKDDPEKYKREYAKSDKYKQYKREYAKSEKYKNYQKEYQKNYYENYYKSDKYKEYKREYQRQYYLKKKQEKLNLETKEIQTV